MTDQELLTAWRSGDTSAGQQLFKRHAETVRRFIINKTDAGRSDAEDLMQRAFLACVEGRDRFEGRSSFRTYLLGIARNLVRQYWSGRFHPPAQDIDEMSIAEMGSSPSSVVARSEHERCLLEGLRRLPLVDQTVLELYYWEQLNGREIGEVLDLPIDTVRSRLRRARERLTKEVTRLEQVIGVPLSTADDLAEWARRIRVQFSSEAVKEI